MAVSNIANLLLSERFCVSLIPIKQSVLFINLTKSVNRVDGSTKIHLRVLINAQVGPQRFFVSKY